MTGRSSRWFPHEPELWPQSRQTHMLLQDFNLHVVPHRDGGDVYQLSVQGISSNQVNQALSLWDQGRGADSFVREVTSTLLTEREAWLEVVLKPAGRDGLAFQPVLVHGVSRAINGNLIQEVPVLDSSSYSSKGEPERQLQRIELDEERMVHVRLPDKYPSTLIDRIAKDLVELDSNDILMLPWVMERMTGQRRNAPAFDSGEAIRTQRLRIAQAALQIGWTARENYSGENRRLGDYYYYWRELRFLHFRSSMRAQAEKALQEALTVAGSSCGFEAHVTARGIYTPVEIEEINKKYESGDIPFSSLNDIIFESHISGKSRERTLL